jgi:hypothetical protein
MQDLETGADVDEYFHVIFLKLSRTVPPAEREQYVNDFFASCERALAERAELATFVFQQMAFFHTDGLDDALLWQHINRYSRTTDPRIRKGLEFGFLRDIRDPPIVLSDLRRLWLLWMSPDTRWAVHAAYGDYSHEQFATQVRRLRKWLLGIGVDMSHGGKAR